MGAGEIASVLVSRTSMPMLLKELSTRVAGQHPYARKDEEELYLDDPITCM
jgi:hypothetical protein